MRLGLSQSFGWAEIEALLGFELLGSARRSGGSSITAGDTLAGIVQESWGFRPASTRTVTFRWGLRPGWAADMIGSARAEKYCGDRPTYWASFRRCLLPASGLVAWGRRPMSLVSPRGTPWLIAGLHHRQDRGGGRGPQDHCVLLTVPSSEALRGTSARQPWILPAEVAPAWLDAGRNRKTFRALARALPASEMVGGWGRGEEGRAPQQIALFA
jgi:putative SOS response-associated peptidase YedK